MKHKYFNKKQLEKYLEDNFIELGNECFEALLIICKNIPVILTEDEEGLAKKSNAINLVVKLKLTEM